jgi:hypothetical protein
MILNLKQLNEHVAYHHFKMDTIQTALKLMHPSCFMASVDLKDAYYLVPGVLGFFSSHACPLLNG